MNERFQYLALLGFCLLGTLPLEFRFAARIYRRPREVFLALLTPFIVFNFVNEIAVTRKLWDYSDRFTTGLLVPRHYPIEEVCFFIAIPLCALLTFEAASRVYDGDVAGPLGRVRRHTNTISARTVGEAVGPSAGSSRSASLQRFLSGLLLASSGLLLLAELWTHRETFDRYTRVGKHFVNSLDWNVPEYTVLTVGLLGGVMFLETAFWHTGIFRFRAYWSTMAICLGFMVVVNGWLTKLSAPIVIYSREEFSGLRPIWDIPLEDYGFGIALLTLVLMSWVRTTRHVGQAPSSSD